MNNLVLMSLALAAGSNFEFASWWWRRAYDCRRTGDFDGASQADEMASAHWTITHAEWLLGTVSKPDLRALWIRRGLNGELRALDQLVCDAVNGDTTVTLEDIWDVAHDVAARMTPHMPCAEHTT